MIAKHFENIVLEKFGFDFSPISTAGDGLFSLFFLFSGRREFVFAEGICRYRENVIGCRGREYVIAVEVSGDFVGPDRKGGKGYFRVIRGSLLLRSIKRFTGKNQPRKESGILIWDLTRMPILFFLWMRLL